MSGVEPVEEGSSGATYVEVACWAGCKSYSYFVHRIPLDKSLVNERKVKLE